MAVSTGTAASITGSAGVLIVDANHFAVLESLIKGERSDYLAAARDLGLDRRDLARSTGDLLRRCKNIDDTESRTMIKALSQAFRLDRAAISASVDDVVSGPRERIELRERLDRVFPQVEVWSKTPYLKSMVESMFEGQLKVGVDPMVMKRGMDEAARDLFTSAAEISVNVSSTDELDDWIAHNVQNLGKEDVISIDADEPFVNFHVDEALRATREARESGLLSGGHGALVAAALRVRPSTDLAPGEKAGYEVVVRSCAAPLIQFARQPGHGRVVMANAATTIGERDHGVLALKYADLLKGDTVERAKVSRSAFENATSVAGVLSNADALTSGRLKVEKPSGGGPGGFSGL